MKTVEIQRPGRFGKFEGRLMRSQHLDAGAVVEYPDRYANSLIASGWAVEVKVQEPEEVPAPEPAEPSPILSSAHEFFNIPNMKLRQIAALLAAGYTTFDKLDAATEDELRAVDTVGLATVARIRRYLRIRQ
jgi:hypothetical protein